MKSKEMAKTISDAPEGKIYYRQWSKEGTSKLFEIEKENIIVAKDKTKVVIDMIG